ncbi:MAG: site-specific DNA-methyltransferase [Deltaproteobacteria bacterium]|jgi:adenine-specific DNA-methyltransferase|nr:site-specific DNA-methyltransferase [Deltaproteobacteria bacterium]
MAKLKIKSPKVRGDKFEALAKLFPKAVTETLDEKGRIIRSIDTSLITQEINGQAQDQLDAGNVESYQFSWPDKKMAYSLANTPATGALRPSRSDSVDFDTTDNLYLEGDNLEVLKLLRQSYLNRVKMIYIDPPYNTGRDFIYNDDFTQSQGDYLRLNGRAGRLNQSLAPNLDNSGRFHTNWLNMIYPRLNLARDFLTDDGVIFISIDDNEVHNSRKICDEIFGSQNFIAELIWERAYSPKNDAKFISKSHDYVLMYAKAIGQFKIGRLKRTPQANARYSNPDNDPRGVWKNSDLSVKTYNAAYDYPITTPSGRVVEPPAGRCWRMSQKAFEEILKDNRVWFGANGRGVPQVKRFLSELKYTTMAPQSILFYKDVGHSQEGAKEVTALLGAGAFDGPKPVRLLLRLLTLANLNADSIVLDFFSGSATTAHAVMELNAQEGTRRKFIMVQLPEICPPGSEAYKSGYKNICQIGKERLRRAGQKLKAKNIDIGFRVFKHDLNALEDKNHEDLLFQIILELAFPLSSKIEIKTLFGRSVYFVNNSFLVISLDMVSEELLTAIAKCEPHLAVFSALASDLSLKKCQEIFAAYSPTTQWRVLS